MISAVIITFNEEKNITRCIDSLLDVADEIVVIDSFSSDLTAALCNSRKVTFIQHHFEGYIQQKNFGLSQARYNYILALDADECLSDELKQSISSIKNNLTCDAYKMKRLNNFCGKWIRHSGWYPDKKIRLWNRNKGNWGGVNPHDKVVMQTGSSTRLLKGNLLHYTVTSIDQFINQQKRFAAIAAAEIYNPHLKPNILFGLIKAGLMFIRRYFFQLGLLDGYYGWIICREAAWYTFLKVKFARDLRNKTSN